MMAQYALDLALEPSFRRDDLLVAPWNTAALRALDAWPAWSDPILLLTGPRGAGKSHLAAIWARRVGARAVDLVEESGPTLAANLADGPLLVEDVDRVGVGEHVLFHFLNFVRERGASALLTASAEPMPPGQGSWAVTTPDLLSRLRLAVAVEAGAPDDTFIPQLLVKLFTDRQIAVDTALIDYAALRIERSPEGARAFVASLDDMALRERRPITRALAARLLRDEGEVMA